MAVKSCARPRAHLLPLSVSLWGARRVVAAATAAAAAVGLSASAAAFVFIVLVLEFLAESGLLQALVLELGVAPRR